MYIYYIGFVSIEKWKKNVITQIRYIISRLFYVYSWSFMSDATSTIISRVMTYLFYYSVLVSFLNLPWLDPSSAVLSKPSRSRFVSFWFRAEFMVFKLSSVLHTGTRLNAISGSWACPLYWYDNYVSYVHLGREIHNETRRKILKIKTTYCFISRAVKYVNIKNNILCYY